MYVYSLLYVVIPPGDHVVDHKPLSRNCGLRYYQSALLRTAYLRTYNDGFSVLMWRLCSGQLSCCRFNSLLLLVSQKCPVNRYARSNELSRSAGTDMTTERGESDDELPERVGAVYRPKLK